MERTEREVYVHYFAQLKDASGKDGEHLPVAAVGEATAGASAADWYRHLAQRYRFTMPQEVVRPALNGRYARWTDPVRGGDELAFIPPVAGG